jgi:tetratricopeptide (TPR) repeat protein
MPEAQGEKARSEAFLKAFRRGEEAVQEGDFTAAIKAYSDAIELDPTNARAFSSRACAYMRVENVAEAVADAKRAKALRARQNSSASAAAFALAIGGSAFRFQAPADGAERGPAAASAGPLAATRTAATGVAAEPRPPPMPPIRVRFRLRYDADFGETLWVTGNHGALGGWCVGSALQLRTTATSFPMWSAAVQLPANLSMPLRYKYVSRVEKTGRARWEDAIPERVLPLEELRECARRGDPELVVYDGAFNVVNGSAALHEPSAAAAANATAAEGGEEGGPDAAGDRAGGGSEGEAAAAEADAAAAEEMAADEAAGGGGALALAADAGAGALTAAGGGGGGTIRVTFQVRLLRAAGPGAGLGLSARGRERRE